METQDLIRLKNKFDIVGNDAALNRALETAVAVAPTDLTVLVIGESGVGKENIPKIIHQNSLRRTGKYFAVNCGAIPEGTIESELFGHEKGSFTGAIADRKGDSEEAHGGTLFLDEIGELPLPYQAKLLRVLQSGEFTRVGSSKVSKTDVRVIAATNVDLRHAVAQGKFRQDLYYRLNAIQINMPALRDMKDDIVLLFRKFSSDYAEKYGMRKISLDRGAIDLLRHYRWPGNIRQLRNIAETVQVLESGRGSSSERVEIDAATLAYYIPKDEENALPVMAQRQGSRMGEDDRQEIFKALYSLSAEVRDLRRRVDELSGGKASKPALPAASAQDSFVSRPQEDWDKEDVDIQEYEQHREDTEENSAQNEDKTLSVRDNYEDLIRKALEKHHGNRKKAADELGISERTLYRKMPAEFRKDGKQ